MQVPRLHPDTVEEVQQRVDIVDVISEHIVLQKRGKDYLGLCPFHNEKTPSFSVSQDKQLYYCFGCSQGGNTFKFLMEIGKQSFAEVVLDLARRYQIPVKTIEPEKRQEIQRQLTLREQLYEILAITTSFYQHALRQPQGEIALNYLKQERNLAESTISQFQLGYAPGGWETLYRYLVEQKRYPVDLVAEAGLIKPRKSGGGYYDVFRDRLIIPIGDSQGRIIGFGSRVLNPDEQPKYLNSPETPLFDKSKTLFALDQARSGISKQDRAIVVEGYFDAIALHAVGINNAVASLGTAFTQNQLKQLLRYTPSKQVILNFDADNAGTKATARAIKEIATLVYGGMVQLRILNLPDGKDADEFLRTCPRSLAPGLVSSVQSKADAVTLYQQSLDNAPLWLDWEIDRLIAAKNLKAADEAQQVATGMIKLLNQLQDANQRNHYLNYCAELLSQGDTRLVLANLANLKSQLKLPEHQAKRSRKQKQTQTYQQANNHQNRLNIATNPEDELLQQAESLLLRIYIHCPRYREQIIDRLEEKDLMFCDSAHRFLWQQIMEIETELSSHSRHDDNVLLTELHNRSLNFPASRQEITQLFYLNEKTQEDIFRATIRITEAIASLEQVFYTKQLMYYTEQLEKINLIDDNDKIRDYCQEIQKIKQKIAELSQIRLASTQEPIL